MHNWTDKQISDVTDQKFEGVRKLTFLQATIRDAKGTTTAYGLNVSLLGCLSSSAHLPVSFLISNGRYTALASQF